ncbi:MAG: glycerate kinase [Neisseria sp.]|uniref:glycerate kinase n=1 Tax=Neisseria sp. TaxID=192066 RepID=UPI0026DC6590|nr:glycerate kinase [Neisseria sp.]MDO4249805.1 glycerate kinase [Neisseria sp.]
MTVAVPQHILVAPAGFKESLDADMVAKAISAGVRRAIPGAFIKAIPMPDGGEGTAEMLAKSTGGRLVHKTVTGPVGRPVNSHFALLGGSAEGVAVVEMAAAAGLRLVPRDRRDPTQTTTYGVGELILAALEHDIHTILIGCGDSGTSDGGLGALQALGARITDKDGNEVGQGGCYLQQVAALNMDGLPAAIRDGKVKMVMALNAHNILTGERGVARVFGPQKGATPAQVEELEKGFENWAAKLAEYRLPQAGALDFAKGAGTGASGGLGAGLAAVGAQLVSRFEALLDSGLAGFDLNGLLKKADLVITAEGAIDFQTPRGKVPAEIAWRAGNMGVPVVALAGTLGKGAQDVYDIGIDAIASIVPIPMSLEQAIVDGERLLIEATERMMRTLLLGASIAARKMDKENYNW